MPKTAWDALALESCGATVVAMREYEVKEGGSLRENRDEYKNVM